MSKRISGVGRVTVSSQGATLTLTVAATREWDANRQSPTVRASLDVANGLAREHGTCDIMTADGILLRQVEHRSGLDTSAMRAECTALDAEYNTVLAGLEGARSHL